MRSLKRSRSSFVSPKVRRRLLRHSPLFFRIGIVITILFIVFLFSLILAPLGKLMGGVFRVPGVVLSLVTNQGEKLAETNGRTNFLLLGMRGSNDSQGALLADTIIFVSVDSKTGDTLMVSLPRDVWVEQLSSENKKINQVYALGESTKKGGGLPLSQAVVSRLLGQPIHYGVRVDFSGFVRAVDTVGSVDIDVERAFDDYRYPVEGKENDTCGHPVDVVSRLSPEELSCRFKHIHFDKGVTHMDGQRALEYVRSRQAEGEEGSDFARSKRQQKVISAFKDKALSASTLFDIRKVNELVNAYSDSVDTNLTTKHITALKNMAQKARSLPVRTVVLDQGVNGNDGLLYHPSSYEYGQWVLLPRGNDWGAVQKAIADALKEAPVPSSDKK